MSSSWIPFISIGVVLVLAVLAMIIWRKRSSSVTKWIRFTCWRTKS